MGKIIFFIVFFITLSWVCLFGNTPYTQDGESLFTEKCGSCHKTGGEAAIFSPVKYAGSQWERFFDKDKHKRKKDIGDKITSNELEMIKDFLVKHAADSDRPIAAGLR
ncbi:MAG: c-type cytochrome [Desulfobacterales bacterium]|nr:c-type cytochrome [Desulfobacterales bacterium]